MKSISKRIFILLTICFAFLCIASVWSSPIPAQNNAKVQTTKRKSDEFLPDQSLIPNQKIKKGTRTYENEDQMKESFREMGRKGGLATSKAYLEKAKGDKRLASKLRSNAAKQSIENKTKEYSQETKKENIKKSDEQYMQRFIASENIARAKGLPPVGHQRRGEGGLIDVGA